jgi:sugar fermentation stimulation protein A
VLIPHPRPLRECRFLGRFDRFVADVAFDDGQVVSAHCVNPGRMEGLIRHGTRAFVSPAPSGSRRKLRWTLELLELDGRLVGANTQAPNTIAEQLVRARLVPGLRRWRTLAREVCYGERSRIDLLLRGGTRDHFVEVKNCHLVYPDGRGYFPDSVSERAAGHLRELAARVGAGDRATVLFVLQRADGRSVRPSRLHDPAFADAAAEAAAAGVRFRALKVEPRLEGYRFLRSLPVDLGPYDTASVAPCREALAPYSGWRRRGPVRA